jgi:DNA transposition AAA+ family ATPase
MYSSDQVDAAEEGAAVIEAPSSVNGRNRITGIPLAEEAVGTLRDRVRAVIEGDEDLTQDQVATEAGMSPTTLSLYLGAKYSGNVANVEKKLEKWLGSRGERLSMQALLPAEPVFFASQTARELMDAFRYAQSLEDMVAVMGVPGIGKSTTCAEYQRQYSNVWIATMAAHTTKVVPALREISEAVGGGSAVGANGLARAITRKIRGTRGLLIIDEAHHLSLPALDAIRALHDATQVAVALVGGPELAARVEGMPQLFSRLGLRLHRRRVLKADIAALMDGWGITGREERRTLTRIAEAPGALRSVTKVLRLATTMARSSEERLQLQHIQDAALTLSARATEESDHA